MTIWLPIEYINAHEPVHIDTVTKAAFISGYIPTLEREIFIFTN